MKVIVSPVGTSAFTKGVENGERSLILKYANCAQNEIPKEDLNTINRIFEKRSLDFADYDATDAKHNSAELNGILSYHKTNPPENGDIYYLVLTDTHIGNLTGELVCTWLSSHGYDCRSITPKGLQTGKNSDLRIALSELVRELDTIYQSYSTLAQDIVFNLTGGFKAVQGFMQSLGTVYATETIYIFESSDALIRIPKLPLKLVAEDYIRERVSLWRKLDLGIKVNREELVAIPESLYYELDGEFGLSEYGIFLWQRLKPELYRECVHSSPSPLLEFSPTFIDSVRVLDPNRYYDLNCRIDQMLGYIESGKKKALKGIDPRKLVGIHKGSTHEISAWADQDAKRIFYHEDGPKVILDRLDRALH